MLHELARFQMGAKVTVDFPDVWRANVVEMDRGRTSLVPELHWGLERSELRMPMRLRLEEALEEIHQRCAARSVREEEWMTELGSLAANDITQIIVEACARHGVTPDELLAEMSQATFDY